MKNLSLILNAVLLVAVGVLFYLHFSGKKSTSDTTSSSVEPGEFSIAYINSDSVLRHYDYLKSKQQALEEKGKKLDQELNNRAQGLRNEIEAYQRNVNTMTLGQVKATEENLGKKQQNLQMYQQSLQQQMMQEEANLNKELYERITVFLKKYAAEKGLSVVLKYDPTSDMLFGGASLDISKEVVDRLNAEYTAEKTGAAPADSTKK